MPEFSDFDVFVNVQGDEPFMSGDAVAAAKEMVTSRKFDVGTAAARAEPWVLDDAGIVKVVVGDDSRALYFSRAGIPYLRDHGDREARDADILQHLGVYAYTQGCAGAVGRAADPPAGEDRATGAAAAAGCGDNFRRGDYRWARRTRE